MRDRWNANNLNLSLIIWECSSVGCDYSAALWTNAELLTVKCHSAVKTWSVKNVHFVRSNFHFCISTDIFRDVNWYVSVLIWILQSPDGWIYLKWGSGFLKGTKSNESLLKYHFFSEIEWRHSLVLLCLSICIVKMKLIGIVVDISHCITK